MRGNLPSFFLFFILVLFGCRSQNSQTIQIRENSPWVSYQFSTLELNKEGALVRFKMSYKDTVAKTHFSFQLPDQWGQESRLWSEVRHLKSSNGKIKWRGPLEFDVMSEAQKYMTISYEVFFKMPHEKTFLVTSPYLKSNYIQFYGHSALILPLVSDTKKIKFESRWLDQETREVSQKIVGNLSVDEVRQYSFYYGDYREYKKSDEKQNYRFIFSHQFSFSDEVFINFVMKSFNKLKKEWKEEENHELKILVSAHPQFCCVYSGLYTPNTVVLFISPQSPWKTNLKRLIVHELLHFWIGGRIKRAYPQKQNFWWSEGFTEYFANLFLLQNHDLSKREFHERYQYLSEKYKHSSFEIESEANVWQQNEQSKKVREQGEYQAYLWNKQGKLKELLLPYKEKEVSSQILLKLFGKTF